MRVYNSNTGSSIYAGIEFGGAGTANDGLAGINGVVTGNGSAALTFYTRDSNTFSEKMRIASTGAATFSSSVTSESTGLNASLRIKNTTATTGVDWHLYSLNNGNFGIYNNTAGAYALQIAPSTGAATFSSSVSTTNGFLSASYNAGDVIVWGGISPYANIYGALSWDVDKAIVKGRSGYALGLYSDNSSTGSKGITILTSGNVGIGTTTPDRDPSGTRSLAISGGGSLAASLDLYGNGRNYAIFTGGVGALGFFDLTAGSERMRITSDGYLAATNTGTYRNIAAAQHSFRNNANSNNVIDVNHSGTSPYGILVSYSSVDPNNTTNYILSGYSYSSSTSLYTIWSNGTTSGRSDVRLKKNIIDSTPKLDKLMQLRVVNYEWKESIEGTKELGLIAQEVEEVFPNLVITEPIIKEREITLDDGTVEIEKYEDGDSKSLKNSVLPYITIKALQELTDLVQELSAKVTALENK
jgi:hypothetical protein